MNRLLGALVRDPAALGIAVATVLVVIPTRSRFAKIALLSAIVVLAISLEISTFDCRRHLTPKFDTTMFVWLRAVEFRALTGFVVLILGASCGELVAKLTQATRGAVVACSHSEPSHPCSRAWRSRSS
jgi:hypothetical protein